MCWKVNVKQYLIILNIFDTVTGHSACVIFVLKCTNEYNISLFMISFIVWPFGVLKFKNLFST